MKLSSSSSLIFATLAISSSSSSLAAPTGGSASSSNHHIASRRGSFSVSSSEAEHFAQVKMEASQAEEADEVEDNVRTLNAPSEKCLGQIGQYVHPIVGNLLRLLDPILCPLNPLLDPILCPTAEGLRAQGTSAESVESYEAPDDVAIHQAAAQVASMASSISSALAAAPTNGTSSSPTPPTAVPPNTPNPPSARAFEAPLLVNPNDVPNPLPRPANAVPRQDLRRLE